tara:strand:- start:90 stop:242 length:153 start_codon:yes stop_codon:yes gene_type:complete
MAKEGKLEPKLAYFSKMTGMPNSALTVESVIARWTSIACRGPCIDLLNAL